MVEANSPNIDLGNVDGVFTWQMPVFTDLRGRLFKAYVAENEGSFPVSFNTFEHFFTESRKNVFRGMHFQMTPHALSKIISLVRGKALVYLLDAREDSPTFGSIQTESFFQDAPLSIYIPVGVALGYLILEDQTTISYRIDGRFCGNCDAGINPEVISEYLPIPLAETIRSERDLILPNLNSAKVISPCATNL